VYIAVAGVLVEMNNSKSTLRTSAVHINYLASTRDGCCPLHLTCGMNVHFIPVILAQFECKGTRISLDCFLMP
jgi:hypothetical protein